MVGILFFIKRSPQALKDLLADPAKLKSVLLYHVVSGKVLAEDIKGMKKVQTLNPDFKPTVSIEDDKGGDRIYLDDAKVLTSDIEVDNGILHIVDMVMFPGQ